MSLIGTFGVMYLCGYSLDNLSLMALTIATGFVVDDAIVVLENMSRHIEEGMAPFEAALLGAREVGFTVLSMSLSLIAVFIPILLMGGIVGRLFREFAVTLSVAILVSLVVSLTTTPMMCARLLRPPEKRGRAGIGAWSERAFERDAAARLRKALAWAGPWPDRDAGAAGDGVPQRLSVRDHSQGLFPAAGHRAPDRRHPGRPEHFVPGDAGKLADFMEIVSSDPAVENVVGFTGGAQRNRGFMFVALKPLAERKVSGRSTR